MAQTFEVVRRESDAAVKTVLGQLQRALTETNLDRSELRQLAVQRLMNFAIAAKSLTEPDRLKAMTGSPGLTRYVDERLAASRLTCSTAACACSIAFWSGRSIMARKSLMVGSANALGR